MSYRRNVLANIRIMRRRTVVKLANGKQKPLRVVLQFGVRYIENLPYTDINMLERKVIKQHQDGLMFLEIFQVIWVTHLIL